MSDFEISGEIFADVDGLCITLEGCSNVRIRKCTFKNVKSGIYALNCTNITVEYNEVTNLTGPPATHSGDFVQFDNSTGSVRWNVVDNAPGQSNPEDIINIYKSYGTALDPIVVEHNWLRGGGPSLSGSGVMAGDQSGAHITVQNNVVIDTGQVGIGVPGGSYVSVLNNTIYSDAAHSWSNVGLYFSNASGATASPVGNNAHGNQVRWVNAAGHENPFWNGGDLGTIDGFPSDNTFLGYLDAAALWASRPDVLSM
jgi:parallel beta-helix repeat protein